MVTGRQIASRMVWAVWALGLGFVGYAASQSFSYTAWFAPAWIFLPLLFINFDQLLTCFNRSKMINSESKLYDRSTFLEVFVPKSADGSSVDHTCVICFCDFEEGETIRRLQCNHSFHKSCIDSFFNRQISLFAERPEDEAEPHQRTVCPICRQDILKRQVSEASARAATAV
jgi:hypothetical protein